MDSLILLATNATYYFRNTVKQNLKNDKFGDYEKCNKIFGIN